MSVESAEDGVRVAVTGAAGMLGTELVRHAKQRKLELFAWTRADFDITEREAVLRAVSAARPDVVIHSAAWTDVDGCESDPERALLVNGRGCAHVAEACRETGARVLLVSTDYVFGGDKAEPYHEVDCPGPISVYGWSKLVAEEVVRGLGPDGTIARTAWVYAEHGRNFLRTMLRLGREREEIPVVVDQVGAPTYAGQLAGTLLDVALSRASGVFHVTSSGKTSWNGFARAIFEKQKIEAVLTPLSSSELGRPARRPKNSVLADTRLTAEGIAKLPPWEEGLAECMRRLDVRRAQSPT